MISPPTTMVPLSVTNAGGLDSPGHLRLSGHKCPCHARRLAEKTEPKIRTGPHAGLVLGAITESDS